jgi:hypothetical protein
MILGASSHRLSESADGSSSRDAVPTLSKIEEFVTLRRVPRLYRIENLDVVKDL